MSRLPQMHEDEEAITAGTRYSGAVYTTQEGHMDRKLMPPTEGAGTEAPAHSGRLKCLAWWRRNLSSTSRDWAAATH